jgi:hypothetical protein
VRVIEHGGSRMGYGSEIVMVPSARLAVILQTNLTGANLPVTIEKVMEANFSLAPKPPKARIDPLPVTADDIRGIAGVFQNGEQRIEIAAKNGRLIISRGREVQVELAKYGDRSFRDPKGAEFTAVPGSDGRIEYLHSGLRSFVRVK